MFKRWKRFTQMARQKTREKVRKSEVAMKLTERAKNAKEKAKNSRIGMKITERAVNVRQRAANVRERARNSLIGRRIKERTELMNMARKDWSSKIKKKVQLSAQLKMQQNKEKWARIWGPTDTLLDDLGEPDEDLTMEYLPTKPNKFSRSAIWSRIADKMLTHAFFSQNRVSVYSDGNEAFGAMFAAMKNAQESIFVETYIFNPDSIGKQMIKHLTDAARRGVRVVVVYDSLGSHALYFAPFFFREFVDAGGELVPFNCLLRSILYRGRSKLFRDHRKVIVIDELIGFCGGMNISEEYCSKDLGGSGTFRDSHLRIIGPAVKHLLKVSLETLDEATSSVTDMVNDHLRHVYLKGSEEANDPNVIGIINRKGNKIVNPNVIDYVLQYPHEEDFDNIDSVYLQIFRSNVYRDEFSIQRALSMSLRSARDHIYITNPYFFPPRKIMRALAAAAKRGADVRIITSGSGFSDVPFVQMATMYIIHFLLQRNVRIYSYHNMILHAKTMVIDEKYCSVGSFNIDIISHTRNLEVSVNMIDQRTAGSIRKHFLSDLKNCEEITLEKLGHRTILDKLMYWVCNVVLRWGSSTMGDLFMGGKLFRKKEKPLLFWDYFRFRK